MPANSRPEGFDLVVVALSARALAQSARRAGLRALSIDLFADADTREHAACAVKVEGRGSGFDSRALLAALETHACQGLPVVFGAGFEDATGLMARIGRRRPIRGAAPEVVSRLKEPFGLARLLQRLSIPHPDIAPSDGGADRSVGWLSKRIGGSGGAHIRLEPQSSRKRYLQRRVDGTPLSALFLADGAAARLVGFSEQWPDPTPGTPLRYGGAVGPVDLAGPLRHAITNALGRIVAATGLVGLASADMLIPREGGVPFVLLEINPRPGATLDVFDRGERPSLLAAHLEACDGRLPPCQPLQSGARAAAVIYASSATRVAGLVRPSWTADWPSEEATVPPGAPVCTILADASTPSLARALLERRRATLSALLPLRRRPTALLQTLMAPA